MKSSHLSTFNSSVLRSSTIGAASDRPFNPAGRLVIIDAGVEQLHALINGVLDGTTVAVLDSSPLKVI